MRFLAKKTCDGSAKGKLAFYCRMLDVSRQGFYDYLEKSRQPWKYQEIADVIKEIRSEDMCNDTYGRTRMRFAIARRLPDETHIPCEATIQKIMREIGISHSKKRKPNGLTKMEEFVQRTTPSMNSNSLYGDIS